MHELSVTESILEIALRHAKQANASRVNEIHLVIGELASIVDDSVQFYWEIIAKDTIAEGAQLRFRRVPVEMLCLDCQVKYQPAGEDYSCPICAGYNVQVDAGREFFVEAIDIETPIG